MNNDNDWLDSILSDELLNVADFGTQGGDLLMEDVFTNGLEDQPMFNEDNFNEPIYSSAASDSGLSSDNLDLDINNDFDLLSSCLPSPVSDHYVEKSPPKSTAKSRRQEIAQQPILKRSTRTNRNNSKYGSATMKNNSGNNNSVKKGDQKILHMKSTNNKARSIIVPVASQNNKEFHSIKIVNSGSAQLKSANIKAVAANLLQKSKQGLLQKNILISKQEFEDDANMLSFDEIMQETDEMIAAHEDDNDDDDLSSNESCSSGYPKLILTNEEKRLLAKEGISLPTSYPLTKQEERELKRIRRKIRNKISAQDSRKRKKEYIDGLEERVKQCSEENHQLIKRIKVLQSQNQDLMSKMKKLQNLLTKTTGKTAQPATCLMILLLSMALVALPNLKLDKQSAINAKDLATAFGEQQSRRNLLFDLKSELEDLEPDPLMYIPNEHDYVENVYKYVSQLSSSGNQSPPPTKRSKMLIDYDIDSMDEWELQKRSHDDNFTEMELNNNELLNHDYGLDTKPFAYNKSEVLSESDRLLVQNIINLAATAALQKSSSS